MIEISSLTRTYGSIIGVENLTFSVKDSEIFALLGPNGAGKTTTLRLMTGMIGPTNGFVSIDGRETGNPGDLREIHKMVGILPETPGHYENLSAARNLQFYGRMYGMAEGDITSRTRELLSEFGLWEQRDHSVATFSKGMKQKLALIRAVIHDPKYVFLDEPLSGLDPEASRFVKDYMKAMKKDGKTVILSTHDLDDADRLSDRVAVIKNALLALDTPSSLKQQSFKRSIVFHLQSVDGINLEELQAFPFVHSSRIANGALVVEIDSPEENNPEVAAYLMGKGFRIQFIGEIRRSLEDVYLSIVNNPGGVAP